MGAPRAFPNHLALPALLLLFCPVIVITEAATAVQQPIPPHHDMPHSFINPLPIPFHSLARVAAATADLPISSSPELEFEAPSLEPDLEPDRQPHLHHEPHLHYEPYFDVGPQPSSDPFVVDPVHTVALSSPFVTEATYEHDPLSSEDALEETPIGPMPMPMPMPMPSASAILPYVQQTPMYTPLFTMFTDLPTPRPVALRDRTPSPMLSPVLSPELSPEQPPEQPPEQSPEQSPSVHHSHLTQSPTFAAPLPATRTPHPTASPARQLPVSGVPSSPSMPADHIRPTPSPHTFNTNASEHPPPSPIEQPQPQPQPQPQSQPQMQTTPEPRPQMQLETTSEPQLQTTPEPRPRKQTKKTLESQLETSFESQPETTPEARPETQLQATLEPQTNPQLQMQPQSQSQQRQPGSVSFTPPPQGPAEDGNTSSDGAPGADGPIQPSLTVVPLGQRSGCFPADATVMVAVPRSATNMTWRRMDQVSIGDRVVVASPANAHPVLDTVHLFTHRDSSTWAEFVHVHTASGGVLRATPGHFIYVNANDHLRPARDVRIGDRLSLADYGLTVVTHVDHVTERGLYNPHTHSGDIMVDGFRVSTYTEALQPTTAHAALSPLRFIYSSLGLSTTYAEYGFPDAAAVSLRSLFATTR